MDRTKARYLPDALVVDVNEIDEQHAGLFQRLAQLKQHCIEFNTVPDDEFEGLLQALRDHFATEAHFAAQAGMNFASHSTKHQKMIKGIQRAADQVRGGTMDIFGLIKFIEYWFERHILDEDKDLAFNIQQTSFATFGEQFAELPHPTLPA